LRVAQILTGLIVLLAALASGVGLRMPGLYRDTAWTVPQVRGQDLVTCVVVVPALVMTVIAVRRGSVRGTMVWIGLLGYVFYTYTGAAFAYRFNELFLVYVALFSLSVFALVAVGSAIDVADIRKAFDADVPKNAVVVFLMLFAMVLAALWLVPIVDFVTRGVLPELIIRAETPTNFVYVLDLGIVVPLALLASVWLYQERPWGFVLAGFILVKATTMGLALLSMTWFMRRAGLPIEEGLVVFWAVLTLVGLGLSVGFFRYCRGTR
jgi:hypothetical protein